MKKKRKAKARVSHGHRVGGKTSPTYASWRNMIKRCHNPKDTAYSEYGGRGIKVCARWRKSFKNFLDDMGVRPGSEYTIDRKENDGNYTPENCRWATYSEQNSNKRKAWWLEGREPSERYINEHPDFDPNEVPF